MAGAARAEAWRYGIGEWYGRSFVAMDHTERREWAEDAATGARGKRSCPWREGKRCNKAGGVCSVRPYVRDPVSGQAGVVAAPEGLPVTVCPERFQEAGLLREWISETILGTADAYVATEIGFLERPAPDADEPGAGSGREDVGRIDCVLVSSLDDPMRWCALEVQAVYFSGDAMGPEFKALRQAPAGDLTLPVGRRRPDWRSSGPKRLMPQLQIKVPTLRRWGKKMAVLVDSLFYAELGRMDETNHLSNADVIWFVAGYEERDGMLSLKPREYHCTTLERAVEGLTAGRPVDLPQFEARIREKLSRADSAATRGPG